MDHERPQKADDPLNSEMEPKPGPSGDMSKKEPKSSELEPMANVLGPMGSSSTDELPTSSKKSIFPTNNAMLHGGSEQPRTGT